MKKAPILLILILIIAFLIRIYSLGTNPPATYGDEISFAWNAWNILKTGTDEYGTVYPLQFRAFDDYKSPIPVYLLVPFFGLFGMNTFILRLPVVLFGVGTILITYLLIKKLLNERIGLIGATLLTISPWHFHLSRGYFESTIALFFFVTGIYFFVLSKEKIYNLYLSAIFFVVTLYTYFTPRIMLLFFIPFLIWWGRKWVFRQKKPVALFIIIIGVLTLPLIKVSVFDKGLSRINKLATSRTEHIVKEVTDTRNSVRSPVLVKKILHNRYVYWIRDVVNDYLEHFSINFWYLYGDSSLRYMLGNMGMFYIVELPFLIIGFPLLYMRHRSVFWLVAGWLLIAPIPAAVSGRPFAVRSLALLPAPFIPVGYGLYYAWKKLTSSYYKRALYSVLVVMVFGLSLSYYLVRYHLEYPTYAATWWGWENKAAVDLALKEQSNFDQIYISNFYTGLELAFAYYTKYDPIKFREAKAHPIILADNREFLQFGSIFVGSLDVDQKRFEGHVIPPKSLYIGRPEEVGSAETIRAPSDGRVLFNIYRTD